MYNFTFDYDDESGKIRSGLIAEKTRVSCVDGVHRIYERFRYFMVRRAYARRRYIRRFNVCDRLFLFYEPCSVFVQLVFIYRNSSEPKNV